MDKKKPVTFLDLDGTIIDVSQRHYKVYEDLVRKYNGIPLSKTRYWKLKKNKTEWSEILKKSLIPLNKVPIFIEEFISKIERHENLAIDSVFPYAFSILEQLSRNCSLYLITLRHSKNNTIKQIKNLGLKSYFKKLLISKQEDEIISKIRKIISRDNHAFVVGDTEKQILIARKLKLISVAVLSGIRNEKLLRNMKPQFLMKNIKFLPKLLINYE